MNTALVYFLLTLAVIGIFIAAFYGFKWHYTKPRQWIVLKIWSNPIIVERTGEERYVTIREVDKIGSFKKREMVIKVPTTDVETKYKKLSTISLTLAQAITKEAYA